MSGDPYPKDAQLARGERRYHRKVASARQWQRIIAAKRGPCRLCGESVVEYHHLIPRSHGGDDTEPNIVPLCRDCHADTHSKKAAVVQLGRTLSAAERAYVGWRLR